MAKKGRPVQTHEELLVSYKKRGIQLMHLKVEREMWKKRAQQAEQRQKEVEKSIKDYVFIDKKPDYFYSFSSGLIFRRWYCLNGLVAKEAEFLILLSYIGVFFNNTYKLFARNYIDKRPTIMPALEKKGYVVKVPFNTTGYKRKYGWVLTQKGKDFEADYEKYYDQKMEERKTGKFTPFNFEDGAYFRRVYVTRHDRRIEQGGGILKPGHSISGRTFRDPSELKK